MFASFPDGKHSDRKKVAAQGVALSERRYAVPKRYFQGCGVVGIAPVSCYTMRVKQVISGKMQRPLGTVSTLKKWKEPVHG
jgi:hypothetical protein